MPSMYRITSEHALPLHDTAATRCLELAAASRLPPHTLMQRAGLAVGRLARALAPHAERVWVACGPGNNGGDGLEAAMHLQQWGARPVVTWAGHEENLPPDAAASLKRARAAGVAFSATPPEGLGPEDLCVDALLGLGASRSPSGEMAHWLRTMTASEAPVLAVDLPSGLQADTGFIDPSLIANNGHFKLGTGHFQAQYTLTLLTVKPGLFTGHGRDAAGEVWFDDLGVEPVGQVATAWLNHRPVRWPRLHASHKGRYGDVAVLGGEGLATRGLGMTGAALLAASAALHAGAGRVLVALLDGDAVAVDTQPELMLRHPSALDLDALTLVCGCGGGEAVRSWLPDVLDRTPRLVLDADALNAIAAAPELQNRLMARAAHGRVTVLTPHPLEAGRLLGQDTSEVQAHRLDAASRLASRYRCVVVLKGSGTVIATPGQPCRINPTGNARLATAGSGDVLAGLVGARLAQGLAAMDAACTAVYEHGSLADTWPAAQALTASELARRLNA
jgi:hydroxyethylthiazole kinase-like uncharacterized protein yjeF